MQGYTLDNLLQYLQKVRGETRVKTKEQGIRASFLHEATKEIFAEHNWPFNKKAVALSELVAGPNGGFIAPEDFSVLNDYWVGDRFGHIRQATRDDIMYEMDGEGQIILTPPAGANALFVYYGTPPDIEADSTARVFFPAPMLIAERAFVRLKTAYFPDENSDAEYARSKRALREFYKSSVPKQNFGTSRW